MTKTEGLFSWAYDHSDNCNSKYSTISHPLYISISGSIFFIFITFVLRYYIFSTINSDIPLRQQAPYVGIFFILYLILMIGTRFYQNGSVALYESLWACNQCLLVSAIALILGDSFIIRSILLVISLDQILWYIDLSSFIIRRKFIVGVAKYIIWEQTTKLRLTTTFHHIWFLPICIWQITPTILTQSFTLNNLLYSYLLVLTLAFIGRISIPKEVQVNNTKKLKEDQPKKRKVYMNINLSRELWKDVKIPFLDHLYTILPQISIFFFLSLFWGFSNIAGFILFTIIQRLL